jgi:hypothetical protein
MISSVRERLRPRETRCRCRLFRFSALAALSGYFGNDFSNNGVLLVISLITVLLAAGVVLPAVWSRKDFRRRAALVVIERFIRWPSVMPGSHLSRFPGLREGPQQAVSSSDEVSSSVTQVSSETECDEERRG